MIVKDGRETLYGHKIYLSGGASGLVLDCVIREGNPADATLSTTMLQRQTDLTPLEWTPRNPCIGSRERR